MGILASILGSGDVIKAGFDLIDDLHTSDVEMIEAKTKAKTDLLNAYAPFKLAQRLLALMFTTVFLSCFMGVLGMALLGDTDVEVMREVISEFWIAEIMFTIIAFYFGGGAFEGAMRAKNEH